MNLKEGSLPLAQKLRPKHLAGKDVIQ